MTRNKEIGIYIIGDEILSGRRQDAHLNKVISALGSRRLQLSWARYIGDVPEQITTALKDSMTNGSIVFSFGGIGATPDDFTRHCAATAAGLQIERHLGAVAEIEAQFGQDAYPKRILMADLPAGAALIPNPVNRVPGFSIGSHHFLPGFPEMAHPMMEWVLDTYYQHLLNQQDYVESSILVLDASESQLLDMMNLIATKYPALKLFSLPSIRPRRVIELGVKGASSEVETALAEIKTRISKAGFEWSCLP